MFAPLWRREAWRCRRWGLLLVLCGGHNRWMLLMRWSSEVPRGDLRLEVEGGVFGQRPLSGCGQSVVASPQGSSLRPVVRSAEAVRPIGRFGRGFGSWVTFLAGRRIYVAS
jgi:hypothetical protein